MSFASAWRRQVVEEHRGRRECVRWRGGLCRRRRGWRSRSERSEPTGSGRRSGSFGRREFEVAEAGAGASSRCRSECRIEGSKRRRSSPGGSNTRDREAKRWNRRKEREEKRSGADKVGRGSIPYLSCRDDDSGWLECGDCTRVYISPPNGCGYDRFWQLHGETVVMLG